MSHTRTADPTNEANDLFDARGDYAPEGLSYAERRAIEADIASLRAGIADFDTACACEQGAFRQWCYLQREDLRREVATLWARLGEG